MILYIDNSNISMKKILGTKKFTQVAGNTVNIKKYIVFFFLYTNHELSKRESKKTIQMKIA